MIKLYTDAAFDLGSGYATVCLVSSYAGRKDWETYDFEDKHNSTEAEYAGIELAIKLLAKLGKPGTIYCDSMGAIDYAQKHAEIPEFVRIEHIKGHQLGSHDIGVDDNVKAHHWADTMAGNALDRRLAREKTLAYTMRVKET
jgi:ribonuclease HI